MKILALTRYGRQGASSRLRVLQYIPSLQAHGFEVETSPFFGPDYLDALYGGAPRTGHALSAFAGRLRRLAAPGRADAILIEKELLPWVPQVFEQLLLPSGARIVVDYDDAVFHRYDAHRSPIVRAVLGSKIARVMRRADLVIAGNPYLSDYARSAGASRVEIVPTVVDADLYVPRAPGQGRPPVVGWIGTPETWRAHAMACAPVLRNVAARTGARIVAVGGSGGGKDDAGFEFPRWSEDSEVDAIRGMDIGIMPLPDTPWSRGKCGYKLIQYMACGLPVVASPVGVNREIVEHGRNGFLAETAEEWEKALLALLRDEELRRRMGQEGRRKVTSHFSLKVQAPRLADLLLGLVEDGRRSRAETVWRGDAQDPSIAGEGRR